MMTTQPLTSLSYVLFIIKITQTVQ